MSVTGFVLRSGGKIRSTIVDIRSTIVDIRIFWSGGAVGAGQTLVAAAQQPANLLSVMLPICEEVAFLLPLALLLTEAEP